MKVYNPPGSIQNTTISTSIAKLPKDMAQTAGNVGDSYDASVRMPTIQPDGSVVLADESNASIADMQKQITYLQTSIDPANLVSVQSIFAAQQQIMEAQVSAMANGTAVSSPSSNSELTGGTSASSPGSGDATSGPSSDEATSELNTSGSGSTRSTDSDTNFSKVSGSSRTGNYQGASLTSAPGPGVQGVFGKKAYGPNTPQGPQTADPYPYIGTQYSGPASNFPPASKWLDFDTLFSKATSVMKAHGDTDDQIAMIKKAIEANASTLDPRVTLCVMMKESGGALNVSTTTSASGGANPGLFQSDSGSTFDPSDPQTSINKMVNDGINGTAPDKTSIIHALQVTGGNIYEALRGYNSGLWGGIANLDNLSYRPGNPPAGDTAYVSNFANLITTGNFV